MDSLAAGLALALGLVLLGLLLLSLRRPIMARIGVRNIPRRPAQSVLIVLGLTLSTTIIIAALSIGDTLDYSIRRYAVDAYGLIDEVLAPPFIQDLLTLAEEDGSLNASDSSSPEAQLLTTLAAGDLNSLLALFQEGLPGIPQERVQTLRAELAADPQVDGVAGAIFFPTIVRDLDTGQGEPLAFIFAVDQAYDQEFGLHTAEGDPVRVADLRPGVGPLFTGAAELYRAANELATQTGSALGLDVEGLPQTALALGAAAVLLSADPPPTFTLRELRVDVATLEALGLDVAFLREQGIDVIRLESLGISDEQLAQLGIDPDAPITLPTLQALGQLGLVQGEGLQPPAHRLREGRAGQRIPLVGDEDGVHSPLHEEELLGLGHVHHHHGAQDAQRARLLHDGLHPVGHGDGPDEDLQQVAWAGVQLLGPQPIQVDLPLAQLQADAS